MAAGLVICMEKGGFSSQTPQSELVMGTEVPNCFQGHDNVLTSDGRGFTMNLYNVRHLSCFFKSSNEYVELVVHTDQLERDTSRTEILEVHKPATLPVLLRLRSYLPLLRKNILKTEKSPKLQVPSLQVQPRAEIKNFHHSSSFLLTKEQHTAAFVHFSRTK